MARFNVVSTPNPDSLKFAAEGFEYLREGMISARTVEEAEGHALAEHLCSIENVANVFVLPQFMTVTKRSDIDWDDLLPEIERALADAIPGFIENAENE